jgi:hypothetical protein
LGEVIKLHPGFSHKITKIIRFFFWAAICTKLESFTGQPFFVSPSFLKLKTQAFTITLYTSWSARLESGELRLLDGTSAAQLIVSRDRVGNGVDRTVGLVPCTLNGEILIAAS